MTRDEHSIMQFASATPFHVGEVLTREDLEVEAMRISMDKHVPWEIRMGCARVVADRVLDPHRRAP